VSSTYVLTNNLTVFPLLVWIHPSLNRCEYIGTLLVQRAGERIVVEIQDEYDRFLAAHPAWVKGGSVAKNLATTLTTENLRRFEYTPPP